MKRLYIIGAVFLLFTLTGTGHAAESWEEFIKEGKFYADIRFRYEFVDQEGALITADAHSKTVRTRIGYKTGEIYGLKAVIEGENVSELGNDDYNTTTNGNTDHPIVADAENTQLNQAYGEYSGLKGFVFKGGRQVITLDGHRFIGHVGWRQNNQVFDGLKVTNTSLPKTKIHYGWIYNVNRIFGEDSPQGNWESNSHFYNISNTATPLGKLVTYGYMLDFGSDNPGNSSKTYGFSISGKKDLTDELALKYHGEYAHQANYGDNPTLYKADYYHLAPAIVFKGLTATVGYEVLGSDEENIAFRTPLATLHKWNGWADKFLTTPAAGLEDIYVDVTYKVSGLEGILSHLNGLLAKVQYHDFSAEEGGSDYGDEWGLFVKKPITKNVWTSVKYSNYDANDFATDTEKVTIDVGFKF